MTVKAAAIPRPPSGANSSGWQWPAGFCWPCFGRPLCQWASFALHSELFSYVLLIPFISAYLIWSARKSLAPAIRPCWPGAAVGFSAGAALLAAYWIGRAAGWAPARQDYLALMMLCFLCWFWGACLAALGFKLMRQVAFPAGFLLFMVPLPVVWLANIDTFLQYTSAAAAAGFYALAREPLWRDGLNLHLSGFSLRVAPECSGIHSTMVLLITSVLARPSVLAALLDPGRAGADSDPAGHPPQRVPGVRHRRIVCPHQPGNDPLAHSYTRGTDLLCLVAHTLFLVAVFSAQTGCKRRPGPKGRIGKLKL